MTIMSDKSDDGSDVDIILEEVSKIYRCKMCFRCFISHIKFAEHFPVYHLETITRITGDAKSLKNSGTSLVTNLDQTQKTSEAITGAFPERTKLSPKRRHKANGSTCQVSETSPKSNESLRVNEPEKNTCVVDEDSSQNEKAVKKYFMKSKSIKKQTVSDTQLQSTPESVLNICNGDDKSEQEVENVNLKSVDSNEFRKKTDTIRKIPSSEEGNVEVITLSDSENEDIENDTVFKRSIERDIVVKNEVVADQETNKVPTGRKDDDNTTTNGAVTATEKPKREKAVVQSIQKKFLCQYCHRLFTRDRTLRSHVKAIHQAELESEQLVQKLVACGGQNGNKNHSQDKGNLANHHSARDNDGEFGSKVNGKRKAGKRSYTCLKNNSAGAKRRKLVTTSTSEEMPSDCLLSFSCKWCPEKFVLLEALKQHAINVHIKYTMVS